MGGETYRALLDPEATPSLAGTRIAGKFKDRLRESSTRERTGTGNVSQAIGSLLLTIEIDAKSEKINCRPMAELDQELILAMDFCKLINTNV